jgi:TonB family protein
MLNVSLQILGHLADASVRALGLAVIACVALAILRTRHAAVRHAVWSAVLAGMLALPLLALLLPPIAVKIMQRPPEAVAMIPRNPQAAAHSASRVAPPERLPVPTVPIWPTVLTGIYIAGVVASLARMLAAWRTCRRLVRRSELIRDPHALDLFADLAAAQSMPWPLPQLRLSRSVIVPMTLGCSDAVILLPDNWQDWDDWKLRAVLAHELAHIRRGDWLVTLAASLNRCLFWFHPLAWWLERKLSALAEQASDDAALGQVADAPRYARTVLDFAAALQSGRRLNYGVAMARSAKVSRRIDRILAVRRPGPALLSRKTWAAIVACALPLVYGAAALQVAPSSSEPGARPGLAQLLTEGSKLSPAEAQQLEEQLLRDPEDLTARGKLISYYQSNAMDAPRLRHVDWLIQHHPESELISHFSYASDLSPEEYGHEKALWQEQVTLHPTDARVLANAATFLGAKDQFAEKDLLERARQADPSNPEWLKRLADLFARAISLLGTPAYYVVPGRAMTPVDESFGIAGRSELESSNDAVLVGTVGEFLSSGPPGGRAPEQPQLDFAEHLLHRAQDLDPDNQEWSAALERLHAAHEEKATPPLGATKGVVRIRVGGEVQQSNLIQKPVPAYPLAAKQARIQGLVRFNVIIGKDGHISHVTLISGHPLLASAAEAAVKQWVYRPTLLNGDPVEVATVIDVQFTLID